jgi:hypothetical protein
MAVQRLPRLLLYMHLPSPTPLRASARSTDEQPLYRLVRVGEARPNPSNKSAHPVKRQVLQAVTVVTIVAMIALIRSGYRTKAMARPPAVPAGALGTLESYSFVVGDDQPEESGAELDENRVPMQHWEPLLGHHPWQGTVWAGYCSKTRALPTCGHRHSCPLYIERQQTCTPRLLQQIDCSLNRLNCLFSQPRCSSCTRTTVLDLLGVCTAKGHSKARCYCHCPPCCQEGVSTDETVSAPENAMPAREKSYFSVETQPEEEKDSERAASEDAGHEFNPPTVSGEDDTPIPRNVVPEQGAPTAAPHYTGEAPTRRAPPSREYRLPPVQSKLDPCPTGNDAPLSP